MPSGVEELLHNAYSFVRGVESNRAIATLTLDHLIQEHIDSIEGGEGRNLLDAAGKAVDSRLTKLERIDAVERDIAEAVKAIKNRTDL
jgi:hypothetical protein